MSHVDIPFSRASLLSGVLSEQVHPEEVHLCVFRLSFGAIRLLFGLFCDPLKRIRPLKRNTFPKSGIMVDKNESKGNG